MMKIAISVLTIVVLMMVGTVWAAQGNLFSSAEEKKDMSAEESGEITGDPGTKEEGKQSNEENPFGQNIGVDELTGDDLRRYIHGMSHQKVKANEKWWFYEISDQRIEWLLHSLDESDISNDELYRVILERWQEGDFSQVVEDHNFIWGLEDGIVGKATRILSEEEERVYINSEK
ncbi:DUF6241 domain-containing protein [Halobacillus ihumii]|uniref:DUF6241 domain-containing protein n=1 Tax=Halobacillus ihumii TaxID=2686092 RepID=UPI0013D4EB19|nr:DUF6241 domain-containing protein [Halobacillus ihumii]